MATAEEILLTMADDTSEYEEVCRIDTDARIISIPKKLKVVGVESDEDVVRRRFRMPWQFGENDLSTFTIRINYLNARGEGDIYPVEDMAKSGDDMTFSWLLSRHATKYKGNIRFVVCMILPDRTGIDKEWNTTLAEFTVLEGLETSGQIEEDNPDVIESILLRLNTLESTGGVSDEQIGNAVNDYLTKNPIQPGATQEQAEQIEANKRAIEELQQNGAGGGITEETDPTVPDWAKADTKPKYTADEVGALPNTTVIPTVPVALPNPQPLTINGRSYDGSEAVNMTIEGGSGSGIHIGSEPPTDDSVDVWINPDESGGITGGGVGIDDANVSAFTTYSSQKIDAELRALDGKIDTANMDALTALLYGDDSANF